MYIYTFTIVTVYIYTFTIVTVYICTVTAVCVYHYFINFTFYAFFLSLFFVQNKLTSLLIVFLLIYTQTQNHQYINTYTQTNQYRDTQTRLHEQTKRERERERERDWCWCWCWWWRSEFVGLQKWVWMLVDRC